MKQFLMTSPVNYSIQNSNGKWTPPSFTITNRTKAAQQWSNLRNALIKYQADVCILPKSPEYCPDTVFTSTAGLIVKDLVIPSRFKYEEQATAEPFFINWFMSKNYSVMYTIPDFKKRVSFEGGADIAFDLFNKIVWYGMGQRSSYEYKASLDSVFEKTNFIARGLELVDPKFFHLSQCLCLLDTGEIIWYPPAFSQHSQELLASWFEGKHLPLTYEEADAMACSSISIGKNIITPTIPDTLNELLTNLGYNVNQVDVSEFIAGGGGCKCLTLEVIK